jgi:short-subunit dehydrogenase
MARATEAVSGPMIGKTVLITGATSGIGRATALGLAKMGADLAIIGRDRVRTEDAAQEIRASGGGRVDLFIADLSSQSEVRKLAEELLQSLARIHVLINNVGGTLTAGMSPQTGSSAPSPSTISRRSCSLACCWKS